MIEDDLEDQEIMQEIFKDLNLHNEIKFFKEGGGALHYLRSTREKPFIIISDVNLPGMSGVMLRDEILKDEVLKRKSIPFIFLSTSDGQSIIDKVYQQQVQGYFQKQTSYNAIKNQFKMIVEYWSHCVHPGQ
mgnify:FL=1